MSLETCPFCGKPFKRLKSHLPHCKMSSESKISKPTNKRLSTIFKHTSKREKTNKLNTGSESKLNSQVKNKSKKTEKLRADKDNKLLQTSAFTLPNNTSGVLPTEEMYMDNFKPKTKWLAKREKEILKQNELLTQTKVKFNLVSRQEKSYKETFATSAKHTNMLEKETVSEQKQVAQKQSSQMSSHKINCSKSKPLHKVPRSPNWQDNELNPMCKKTANISQQIETIPKPFTTEYALSSGDKKQHVSVFQTKTCVWDHIQYRQNRNSVSMFFPIVSAHKLTLTDFVNSSEHVLNPQNAILKVSHKQFPILQSSIQKPMPSSRFQNLSVLPYSPDMVTGYGETLCISHSEITYKNAMLKCQTSKPSSLNQVTDLGLGDVRLNELSSWLVARMPESPREAASMCNKGWQWYYRKYIDVQKGGIGGLAMLIGSYCVLSYVWR